MIETNLAVKMDRKEKMDSKDIEIEARFFRHNINSKLKDAKLRFEKIKALADQAIEKLDESSWQCWDVVKEISNRVGTANDDIYRTLDSLQDYVDSIEDKNREIIRHSHKYTYFCERHEVFFKKTWADREPVCESCLEEAASHNEFVGTAAEDR